jgi:tetratricopeptide (TPR) repeat protein
MVMKQLDFIRSLCFYLLFIGAITLLLFGCNVDSKKISVNEQIISYHKIIIKNIDAYKKNRDKKYLYDALKLSDEAIRLNKYNMISYANKTKVWIALDNFMAAQKTIEKAIELNAKCPELYLYLGFLFEKQGDKKNADVNYKNAILLFEKELKSNPGNIDKEINFVFAKIFTEGPGQAEIKIVELEKTHPNDENIKMIKTILKSFNKEKFINDLFE